MIQEEKLGTILGSLTDTTFAIGLNMLHINPIG